MMNDSTPETRSSRPDLGVWIAIAGAALAIGLVAHSLFPRYQLTPVGVDAVVVFDRWTGAFQRATYGPDGEPRATAVLRPF
jgi:hypothetical protein